MKRAKRCSCGRYFKARSYTGKTCPVCQWSVYNRIVLKMVRAFAPKDEGKADAGLAIVVDDVCYSVCRHRTAQTQ